MGEEERWSDRWERRRGWSDRWERRRGGMGVVGGEGRRWSVQRGRSELAEKREYSPELNGAE